MDGFLNIQFSIRARAIITRLVAISPCIFVSVLFPNHLNQMVNIVNSSLSFLLPFAFTPLVKYNCSESIMGKYASKGCEKYVLHFFAFSVWLVNAFGLSSQGGGFFGDVRPNLENSLTKVLLIFIEIFIQVFYFWWNWNCLREEIQIEETELELT